MALLAMSGGLYAAGGRQEARAAGQARSRKTAPQTTAIHIVPPTPLNARLWKAIVQGDLNAVRALIAQGANPDAHMEILERGRKRSYSFATIAGDWKQDGAKERKRFLPVFQWLLPRVSNIEATNDSGYTLLMQAVLMDDLASVKLLVSRGAKINAVSKSSELTALWLALWEDKLADKDLSPITLFLLEHGADSNVRGKEDTTPLMMAAEDGRIETVKALLAHGANPALRIKGVNNALGFAKQSGHNSIARLLAEITPLTLFEAAEFGKLEQVRAHLDAGDDVNSRSDGGVTLLIYAIRSGNAEIVKLLLDRGAKIRSAGADGFSPLLYAVAHRNTAIAALLLDRGADINVVFHFPAAPAYKMTPLLSVLMGAGSDFLDLASFNARPTFHTPLTLAADAVDADMIDLLIRRGADIKQNDQGAAALEWVAQAIGQREHIAALERDMQDTGLRQRAPREDAPRVLKVDDALIANQFRAVERLVAAGVDTRADHSRALYLAALSAQPQLVSLLLQKGADVNGRGPAATSADAADGPTALMGAIQAWDQKRDEQRKIGRRARQDSDAQKARVDKESRVAETPARNTAELLLAMGADANATTGRGITPLMECYFLRLPEAAQLLLNKGANVDAANKRGRTLLMDAVVKQDTAFAEFFLAHKADVNKRTNRGATTLMLAIDSNFNDDILSAQPGEDPLASLGDKVPDEGRHIDMVRLLLEHGADVNLAADDGTTALQLAKKNKFKRIIALLTKAGAK